MEAGIRSTAFHQLLLFSKHSVEKLSVLFIVCLSKKKKKKSMASDKQFRLCVSPCPRNIPGGDTHELCVSCLGVEHAQA